MPRRLSRQQLAQIRSEVAQAMNTTRTEPVTVRATLSCGHEDDVPPGIDVEKAICTQCRADGMRHKP